MGSETLIRSFRCPRKYFSDGIDRSVEASYNSSIEYPIPRILTQILKLKVVDTTMSRYISLDDVPIDSEFYSYIRDLVAAEPVLQMKQYIQHGTTTTFDHCLNVAYYNYRVCKRFNLDARSGARAGMLHDLFLYDWHYYPIKRLDRLRHGATHPKRACENASRYFELTPREKDIISKHMFPMTVSLPKYRETVVIILVDKYCGLLETVLPRLRAIKGAVRTRRRRNGEATVYLEAKSHD